LLRFLVLRYRPVVTAPVQDEVSELPGTNGTSTEDAFAGKVAIVTGGGSGIGAAVVRALAGRGATIVIADIDEAAAKSVADEIDARSAVKASTAVVDVRDSDAVADLVNQVAADHGSLDLMFNNAGIAVAGLVDQLTLDHWDRVIDVNLKGVVHGVHAAYPLMLRQGHGHIVNTASLAGLVPGPGLAPYVAVKHAVVGLSMSLRAEAAIRGVKVSAVCPGFVDTPLLGRVNPGLPQTETGANAETLARMLGKLYQADLLAADVLRGVEQNRALIVAPRSARIAWRMSRYAPRLMMRTIISGVRRAAAEQAAERAPGSTDQPEAAEPSQPA
jgi:NAD(P)-dependent dehydrogenase (short-subunit alcohol dehydrogenase family)